VANDPNGPLGLGVGPQQLTGSPAIGNGLFKDECKARSFFERRLIVKMGENEFIVYVSIKRNAFVSTC
jgi:hypothetical protein